MEILNDFKLNEKRSEFYLSASQLVVAYSSIENLLTIYTLNQEKSIVKAQNEVALQHYLPTNSTLFLKDEKQKRQRVKYVTPDNWKDAFKLIKLLWQTRQLA
jgi:hypothetical protein